MAAKNSKKVEYVRRMYEQPTFVIGVDVSKAYLTTCAVQLSGLEMERKRFYNSGNGFKAFYAWLQRLKHKYGYQFAVVGLEPTGTYSKPLIYFLAARGVCVVQVNPVHVKRSKDMEDNSPDKSDKKDPKVIANLVREGKFLTVLVLTGPYARLRQLVRARDRAVAARTQCINQMEAAVAEIFPEFLQLIGDLTRKTALELLSRCPTPRAILSMGLEGLQELVYKTSRGRIRRDRVEALWIAAQESVGVEEAVEETVEEVRFLVKLVRDHTAFIEAQEKQIRSLVQTIPYGEQLLSIQGIGPLTVAVVLGELGDLRRFRTRRDVLKHAGLNLYRLSSGTYQGLPRISKRGSGLVRKYLFLVAMAMVRPGGIYHDFYQRYTSRHEVRIKGIVAVMRKLLALMFALVRKQEYFDATVLAAA